MKSCFGHIRDLPKKDAIDIEDDYKPKYVVPDDKKKVVTELKKIAKAAETVWLATDEDREGEAISWHLCDVLGLDPAEAKRIVFHEITKDAILKAVNNPRNLNLDLVNAQQARRILDRLVGFELSPVLWRKVSAGSSKSAGRVQSVAVRLIVEREAEIKDFNPESSFRIRAIFNIPNAAGSGPSSFEAECPKRFGSEEEARKFLEDVQPANFEVAKVTVKPAKKSPAAPFTTSTMQQEASRKLSFSVARTMSVAQKLYENGHITYMRTDSVNLSDLAINAAKDTITEKYGADYSRPHRFKTKSGSAQEAHEAIRPTDLSKPEVDVDTNDMDRLYRLIWQRAIASQMSEARFERTTIEVSNNAREENLVAKGEVLIFDGFLKVYREGQDEEGGEELDGLLPSVESGQGLDLGSMTATQRFSKAPARYTEASLVRKLEELGIGRPSTYAPTISTIQKREYVEKGEREGTERNYRVLVLENDKISDTTETEITGREKAKLFPTDLAILVNDFLIEHFSKVMDYGFTASIEKQFDSIADGEDDWVKMIDGFYKPFHKNIEHTLEHAERVTGARKLGVEPDSGKPVYARMGKYGPMVQVGDVEDEEKPRFAKIPAGMSMQTLELADALKLLALPRNIGSYRDDDLIINRGRFGPYVRNKNKFYSIKEDDPMTITAARAIEIIKVKDEEDAKKHIQVFEEEGIAVLRGRYGPYLKKGRMNYRIPKDVDPEKLSLEDCQQIIEETVAKRKKKKA